MKDNAIKQKMLRYAQLAFKKQKSETPLTQSEEVELASLPAEIGLSPAAIIKAVTESLLDKM